MQTWRSNHDWHPLYVHVLVAVVVVIVGNVVVAVVVVIVDNVVVAFVVVVVVVVVVIALLSTGQSWNSLNGVEIQS